MKRLHRILYLWHRYFGLAMALFLTIAALTGSILAFSPQINRWAAPQKFATPRPGVPHLELPTLIARVQEQVPTAMVRSLSIVEEDQAYAFAVPKKNPVTGKPYDDPGTLWVDPWTGKILVAYHRGDDLSQGGLSLVPFILHIHDRLLVPGWGFTFMGIVALFWLLDCFVALYLTMPQVLARFFHHWKPSWLIKANASPYRLNLDLHRAFGLWLWPIIFIFAASSVMFNLPLVWRPLTNSLFGSREMPVALTKERPKARKGVSPLQERDWNRAFTEGRRLLADLGTRDGVGPGTPATLSFGASNNAYTYVESGGLNVGDQDRSVTFDLESSEVVSYSGDAQKRSVGTDQVINGWLIKLHMAHSFGLLYQIFVAFLGLVIAMFSVTGVYLWWKKRSVRRSRAQGGASAPAEA